MKKTLLVLIVIGILLSPIASFAQALTDWERGVFREISEKWHALLYTQGGNYDPQQTDFDRIFSDVAAKYNTSVDEVKKIDNKGLDEDPGEQAYKIYNELTVKLNALPKGAFTEDSERAHAQVAGQFGISLIRLHEIEYVMEEGMWAWW